MGCLPGRKYGQPCGAWPPPPQSTEHIEELMATTSLFQGINSSEGIDSAMELIFRRNRFLKKCNEKNNYA